MHKSVHEGRYQYLKQDLLLSPRSVTSNSHWICLLLSGFD